MRKVSQRDVERLAQAHMASERKTISTNSASNTPAPTTSEHPLP